MGWTRGFESCEIWSVLHAALLDVGGTMWLDRLTAPMSDATCLEQLGRLVPGVNAASAPARIAR
jgi:hypothetical protein